MRRHYYVYVLKTLAGRPLTYVGWTLDLDRRLAQHNGKAGGGAKSTSGRAWALVYAEKFKSKPKAMAREYALKQDRALRAALRG